MDIYHELVQATLPEMPHSGNRKIGCIGSGFIMTECQLVAYQKAGFTVEAITSRTFENACRAAKRFQIPKVYKTVEELLADPEIEIIDIAIPPHLQKNIVEQCCKQKHIKGILCQKPLALSIADMNQIRDMADQAGIVVEVNQNMRYDQSIRALKWSLEKGYLGKPVLASIDLRCLAKVQPFYQAYNKFEILDLAIHHLDCFRYLFGNPEKISAFCRTDPRTHFNHKDGLSEYILQYKDGLLANSIDDGYAGPDAPCESDHYIKWRVEGDEGIAEGTIGWYKYPEISPSTFRISSKYFPQQWITPEWDTAWFPDAFAGTMADLMCAIEEKRDPSISVADNINTMALVEACYQSIDQERTIYFDEIDKERRTDHE